MQETGLTRVREGQGCRQVVQGVGEGSLEEEGERRTGR